VNRSAGAEPHFSEPLPDAAWPVAARNLLTQREQSLYQRLLSLYPDHKIFVQVALSQLIDVPEDHRAVYPNVSNGAVSIANSLILWDFDIRQLHSE
jgi:hypothetical protein